MKAMVLAAGLGRRLRPLTDRTPKALIEVDGQTMLERSLRRLIAAGVDGVAVNVFHLAEPIVEFLRAHGNFAIRVAVFRETTLLDTGGGLKNAASFFDDGRPFFVHNVDVVSDVDLSALYRAHSERPALATLFVHDRPSPRKLLFSDDGRLCGRQKEGEPPRWTGKPAPRALSLAFSGLHVASPAIFAKMTESGVFSLTDAYLRLAAAGERIQAFRDDGAFWADIGSFSKLEAARQRLARGR